MKIYNNYSNISDDYLVDWFILYNSDTDEVYIVDETCADLLKYKSWWYPVKTDEHTTKEVLNNVANAIDIDTNTDIDVIIKRVLY